MKPLIILLAALSVAIPQEKPAAAPVLTVEQKLKLRDAQVATLTAQQKFSEYMQALQRQIEAIPDYQRLKAAADLAAKNWTRTEAEIREQVKCAECELNAENMMLTRPVPKQAKLPPTP